jgi:hypothetical protein
MRFSDCLITAHNRQMGAARRLPSMAKRLGRRVRYRSNGSVMRLATVNWRRTANAVSPATSRLTLKQPFHAPTRRFIALEGWYNHSYTTT